MRRRRMLGMLGLLVAAGPVPGDELLAADGGFEVGGAGFVYRTGRLVPERRVASIEQGGAAEGERWLRLRAPAALELPWTWLEGGGYSLSAYLAAAGDHAEAACRIIPAVGETREVRYPLTRDWRRYAAPCRVGASGWFRFELLPVSGELRLDGVRLAAGDEARFEPGPVLGVLTAPSLPLHRSGDRVDGRILLCWPGGGTARVAWRLEDPFGHAVRGGELVMTAPDARRAEDRLQFENVAPGAYRLAASARVGDRTLVEDATFVAVVENLRRPARWCGVTGLGGSAGLAAMKLLRVGLCRGVAGPEPVANPVALRDELVALRHAGIGAAGFLPGPLPDETEAGYRARVAAVMAPTRREIEGWEAPPELEPRLGSADYAAWAERAGAAAKAVDRHAVVALRRVGPSGAVPPGDGPVTLVTGDTPPEAVGGEGLEAVVRRRREELARDGRLGRVAVLVPGWPSEPWDRSLPRTPLQAAGRVDPVSQASFLARSLLLARAAGAEAFWYGGAAPGDVAPALTLAAPPRADLVAPDGASLPAVAALSHALERLDGRHLGGELPLGWQVHCLRWSARAPLAVLWQWRRPGRPLACDLPLPPEALSVTDLFGHPVAPYPAGSGCRLEVDVHPLYVEAAGVGAARFWAAWQAARMAGQAPAVVAVGPAAGGAAVVVRNVGGQTVTGGVALFAGAELLDRRPLPGLAPGETGRVVFAAPWPGLDGVPLRAEVEAGGARLEAVAWPQLGRAGDDRWLTLGRLRAGTMPEPGDLSATFRAVADAAGLRLEVRVVDDALTAGDAVTVYAVGGLDEPETLLSSTPVAPLTVRPGDAEIARTAEGYRVALTIPWARLGGHRARGVIGLDLTVRDADGGTVTELGWRGPNGRRPAELGWLGLGPEPSG